MIASERLDLVTMTGETLAALVEGRRDEAERLLGARLPDGWPAEETKRFLSLRLTQLERDPSREPWLPCAIVLREAGEVVGHAGFHGPPGVNGPQLPDAVEIGYRIFDAHRGRGLATEAVVALLEWAFREHGIRRYVASVAPDNAPSLAIVRKLGFVQTGELEDDEDGLELVFELRRT